MTANPNPGCLYLITSLFGFSKSKETASEILPYKLRTNILSPAEFSFYKVLQIAIQNKLEIQCKVRLADIFYTPHGTNISYFNRIARKHIDFLLCNQQTMKPILGIELDDSTHAQPDRIERDLFVDKVFQIAGLPILHLQAKRAYNPEELMNEIKNILNAEL
jgi:hypothetical protein